MSHPGVDFGHPRGSCAGTLHGSCVAHRHALPCPAILASLIAREFQELPTPRMSLAITLLPALSITLPHPTLAPGCVRGWRRHCRICPANLSLFHQLLITTHSLTASLPHAAEPARGDHQSVSSWHQLPSIRTEKTETALRHQRCDQAQTTDDKPEPWAPPRLHPSPWQGILHNCANSDRQLRYSPVSPNRIDLVAPAFVYSARQPASKALEAETRSRCRSKVRMDITVQLRLTNLPHHRCRTLPAGHGGVKSLYPDLLKPVGGTACHLLDTASLRRL